MKNILVFIMVFFIVGCSNTSVTNQVYLGAEAGPIEVKVAVNDAGEIIVSGSFNFVEETIGFVTLEAGIDSTLTYSQNKDHTLFIVWQDENGEVKRKEYKIGTSFDIDFTQNEIIKEIKGQDNNIIVRVEIPNTQFINLPSISDNEEGSLSDDLSPVDPETFVRKYFSEINNRNYELTWSMLSPSFQSNHTFNEYTEFWDSVNNEEIQYIKIKSENNNEVFIYVEMKYYYANGSTPTGHTTYKLVKYNNSWLFEPD